MTSADRFHEHLDVCQQCREHPIDLCQIGHELLVKAGFEAQKIPGLRQCPICGRPEVHCTCMEGAETPPAQTLDHSADQRQARTRPEVESMRRAIGEEAARPGLDRASQLELCGAFFALSWVLADADDGTLSVIDRIRNHVEGR